MDPQLTEVSQQFQRFKAAFVAICCLSLRLILELEDISNDETLRKLPSGKVGNMFLLSKNDRFIIKILRKSEIKVILEMLSGYFLHIHKYRSTLLSKNYGAHSVKPIGGVCSSCLKQWRFF